MTNWFRTLGPPPDVPSAVALVVGVVLVWQGPRLFAALYRAPRAAAIVLLAALALALSAGYVQHYLGGGPRIIDATSYWLEARALSEGHVSWPIEEPTASVRGRFLLLGGTAEAPRLGVIFPPGYPLVLAMGFVLGVPLWVGPFIAALLVVATYALAKAVTRREDVARLAATLSVLCATLRYHTADTMSHGWAALMFAASLALAWNAADAASTGKRLLEAALSGVLWGWLFATRPVSATALLPIMLVISLELTPRARWAWVGSALVPLTLFFLQQRAVTGVAFLSSQAAYYAIADGPPGCFRYGFGSGIGCLHEHGAYVADVLPNGLDAKAAFSVLLRRLRLHVIDVANLEPVTLLVVAAPFFAWFRGSPSPAESAARSRRSRAEARRTALLCLAVLLIVLAYVPFYFDGSYAGGGARFFADVLPLEHVLVATCLALIVERAAKRWPSVDLPRASALLGAVCLAAFGVHTVFEHRMMRERDGGRPFFEPQALTDAKVDRGLLFVGTDHAFNLAYDPAARDPERGIVVAREFGDDRDRLVWERLGRPVAHRYVFEGRDLSEPAVVPWSAGPPPTPYRFEAEAEWPPIRQTGGALEPVFAHGTCAWGGRFLAVNSEPDRPFEGTISFPVPAEGTYRIGIHVASIGDVNARFVLRAAPLGPPLGTWGFATGRRDLQCSTLTEELVSLGERGFIEVTARGGSKLFVDAVALEPIAPVVSAH